MWCFSHLACVFLQNTTCTILDKSKQHHRRRKRAYRHRVKCSESKKEIVVEYQDAHAGTKHIGKKVKFTICRTPNQSQLHFTGGDETITNMVKCSKIDAENVASDLQNDIEMEERAISFKL